MAKEIKTKKDITVAVLKEVATELVNVFGLKPPIDVSTKATKNYLEEKITQAATMAEPGDKFSEQTVKVCELLGTPVVAAEGAGDDSAAEDAGAVEGASDDKSKSASGKKGGASGKKPASNGNKYSRLMGVADAVNAIGADDKEAVAVKANELYVANGGKDNIKESKWATNTCLQFFSSLVAGGAKVTLAK